MRSLLRTTLLPLIALSPIGATSAWAQTPPDPSWVPAYSLVYYSDASQTEQVGFARGYCTVHGPALLPLEGVETSYYEQVLQVWCDEHGNDHPI